MHDALTERLEVLRSYEVLDTLPEEEFDGVAALAASICEAPIALVSLVDEHRQWFKAELGLGVRETPIEQSVCACVMHEPGPLQIEDLRKEAQFCANPLVTGNPNLRFYAGAPLRTADGFALGMLCVLDTQPRSLAPHQLHALGVLAKQVMAQLELRRQAALADLRAAELQEALRQREKAELELRRSEQKRRDSEECAQLAAEAAEIGIYDWDPRTDRVVWSDALRRQFGLDLGEEVSLDVALGRIHLEDRQRVTSAIQRALDPAGDGRYDIEYRTTPAASESRWLHVLGRVRFEEHDGRKEAVRFSGVSVNVTRQKRLEEELRFQLDLTRLITDNATTAILMMNEHGECTFMNPAAEAMTGYTLAEVRGGTLHEFIHHHHPDGRAYPAHECPIDRALPEQFDVIAHEDVFVRKNGEFFPVVVNAKPIRKNGRAVGTLIEVRDVTVEREALQRLHELTASLAEADRRKDDFLATLAHELRNPLAPIRTASSLLGSRTLPAERITWASQVIQRQVTHMGRLLDDLLDVGRITKGKLKIVPHRVCLADVVNAAVESAQTLIDEKNHQLSVQLPQGAVFVEIDALRVSQIVGNLLANAARYTPAGGAIELRAVFDGADLLLCVSDNGVGLEPEELDAVFDMFQQGKAGLHASGGLGIGLGLSRGLAQLHGGDLTAKSEGPGRGSVFELRLPQVLACPTEDGSARASTRPSGSMKILLADDNRDAVDVLALMLQMEEHDVRTVYAGKEAIKVARKFKPDAVVLDIGMPDMTGYEVARVLKREPWAGGCLFVALSGWGQKADKELAKQAGFEFHLTKPADPGELSTLLQNWVGAGRLRVDA